MCCTSQCILHGQVRIAHDGLVVRSPESCCCAYIYIYICLHRDLTWCSSSDVYNSAFSNIAWSGKRLGAPCCCMTMHFVPTYETHVLSINVVYFTGLECMLLCKSLSKSSSCSQSLASAKLRSAFSDTKKTLYSTSRAYVCIENVGCSSTRRWGIVLQGDGFGAQLQSVILAQYTWLPHVTRVVSR